MLQRQVVNKQYVYYKQGNDYILINTENGKWYCFDQIEKLNECVSDLTNDSIDSKWKNLLSKCGFFRPVDEYSNPTLHLHLTNKCNLRCPHCYMRAESGLDNELSADEFKKLISDFKKVGGKRVIFSGGEISLVKEVVSIIKHAKSLGLYTLIITNGTLWKSEDIISVASYVDCVQVRIDGYDEKSNAKIRGATSFGKALQCMDAFIKAGAETLMTVTPLYGFENEIDKYIEFGKRMVEQYADKPFYVVFNDNLSKGRSIDPNPEKNELYYQATLKILEGIYPGYKLDEFWHSHKEPIQNCGYGKIAVDSDGQFAFCTSVKDVHIIGNVRTMSMEEIFSKSNELARLTSVNSILPCKKCDFKYICGGGCRIDHFIDVEKIGAESAGFVIKKKVPCTTDVFEKYLDLMRLSAKKHQQL